MHMSNSTTSQVLDCLNMFEDVIFKILFTQRKYFFISKSTLDINKKKSRFGIW